MMELMPLCIHGDRGPVFFLPHFAQQNFTDPAATGPVSHRVSLPSHPSLAPAPGGSGADGCQLSFQFSTENGNMVGVEEGEVASGDEENFDFSGGLGPPVIRGTFKDRVLVRRFEEG